MKKIGFFLFAWLFLLGLPGLSHAASSGTHIYLDGQELVQPENAQAGIVHGSVMVPIRVIVEGLGYDVNWDKANSTLTIKQGETNLKLKIGEETSVVDERKVKLNGAPFLQGDTTLVPLRFVGEQMGLNVSWNNESKSAYLYSPVGGSADGVLPGHVSGAAASDDEIKVPADEPGQDSTYTPSNDDEGMTADTREEEGKDGTESEVTDPALITGISFGENRLMFAVSGSVEPNAFTMTGPDRIVVDVPNAGFDESFLKQYPLDESNKGELAVTGYPDVSKIRYSLYSAEPGTVRFVIDLNRSSQFKVTNNGDGLVTVDLTADAVNGGWDFGADGKPIVVIDAGHGGTQPGATSITKRQEKDFTLAVALKVQALLEQETEFDFVMTRDSDVTLSLQDRVKIANDIGADVFVSIHGNSIDPPANPSGSETYYTREESIPLANVMHSHLVQATGLADRKVRYSSLHVTRETTMPAVLLEVGYLSNKNDESLMYTEELQQRVAEGIVAGIKEYLGL
ncbi:AMIN domain-containing protein [Paenibacillus oralis]|uniref:AMIN domain-containing protein n=1 Tax=Paenibacillus oralis TaxID=2490856 RepID=A0A3P3U9K8_9BACL|nr:N-acetylmuramoyl-L-alanine amidase family protein [Paenibacillus oralis]RRJ66249.1 AMIN domain-containing protein [Paenibacillus oralis]